MQDNHRSSTLNARHHVARRTTLAIRAAQRIKFKLAKLTYVACTVQPPTPLPVRSPNLVADIPSRRRLRSFATDALLVRLTRLVTVGDRAVPVAVGGGCGGGGGSSSSSSSSS